MNFKRYGEDIVKNILNLTGRYKFETSTFKKYKAVNAESKQAISTLNQIGFKDYKLMDNILLNQNVSQYLNKFDWSFPWNAGAQFSSLCIMRQLNLELKTI